MEEQSKTSSLWSEETHYIQRMSDRESFYLHCSGGFRAGKVGNDRWMIEPILDRERPSSKGFFSLRQLEAFLKQSRITPVAFQHSGWTNGSYYSLWIPLIPGQANHQIGASDLWGNIAGNLGDAKRRARLSQMSEPKLEAVAAVLDEQDADERLALFISLSLRGMDISVEQIGEFYNENLVNGLAEGKFVEEHSSTTLDQVLFSHVHSFFMHAGAARDYLGALIAFRVGMDDRKDDFARFIGELRTHHLGSDPMLDFIHSQGLIAKSTTKLDKFETSGWLKDLSVLRKTFIHKRPFGSKFLERFGALKSLRADFPLYRYYRPVVTGSNSGETDVFDLIISQYRSMNALFHQLAYLTGSDTSVGTITDADIITARVKE
ncbi:hypothetical protein [Neorhizobium petrolearium]|uniref:hypothetical protein n=1 Tax=Neorhizobium petrolearium TaxID=515361 RepID=UPI003F7E2983